MGASVNSKTIRYEIAYQFLRFWFRFIYKNRSATEIGNYTYVKDIIDRDHTTYSGIEFENFVLSMAQKKALFIEAKRRQKNYS